MNRKLLALFGGFCLVVASCTLTPRDTGRAFMFALQPAPPAATHKTPSADTLTVALPAASPELDTYRIALIRDGGRWDYYAAARWSDFLPLIVQNNLTESLAQSKLFKGVSSDQSGIDGDEIMSTDIRDFQAVYEKGAAAPVIKVRLAISLHRHLENTNIMSFEVSGSAPAAKDSLSAIQSAFAAAFRSAQQQVIYKLKNTKD